MNDLEKILAIIFELYVILGSSFVVFCFVQGLTYKISKHKINIYKSINKVLEKIMEV